MNFAAEELEKSLVAEFSSASNQIAKNHNKLDRRERIRRAIYMESKMSWRFGDTQQTYAEVFLAAYGERLDRRAIMRELSEDE